MALQFGPSLVLLPLTGWMADHVDRRKVLFVTQGVMGLLALTLGLLTVFGAVRLWHVYAFAFLLGCVTAFDAPARQAFVSELVEPRDLANAVALNSTSFQARLNGHDPYAYLRDVFERLPSQAASRIGELLPHRW